MLIGQVKLLEKLWFDIYNFGLEPQWGWPAPMWCVWLVLGGEAVLVSGRGRKQTLCSSH